MSSEYVLCAGEPVLIALGPDRAIDGSGASGFSTPARPHLLNIAPARPTPARQDGSPRRPQPIKTASAEAVQVRATVRCVAAVPAPVIVWDSEKPRMELSRVLGGKAKKGTVPPLWDGRAA